MYTGFPREQSVRYHKSYNLWNTCQYSLLFASGTVYFSRLVQASTNLHLIPWKKCEIIAIIRLKKCIEL